MSAFGTLDSWTSTTQPSGQNANSLWVNSGADNTVQAVGGDQANPQQEHTNSSG